MADSKGRSFLAVKVEAAPGSDLRKQEIAGTTRQTNGPAGRRTGGEQGTKREREREREADERTGGQTDRARARDKEREREERQTNSRTASQPDSQTARQPARQTDKKKRVSGSSMNSSLRRRVKRLSLKNRIIAPSAGMQHAKLYKLRTGHEARPCLLGAAS